MGKAIMELEEELFKRKEKELESIRFVKRTITTKAGSIDIRRRLYKDKKTGENGGTLYN
jgi:hypothetical protein